MTCLYLARIGRPDVLWSVNKLARAVTKWTKSCDKRLALWFLTFITQVNLSNIVMWETLLHNADWDCFETLILPEILKTQDQHLEEFLCILGGHTFVPIGWMCKKQTSVSHSSTETEIISLDAGLRMDGIPALDLWVFGYRSVAFFL